MKCKTCGKEFVRSNKRNKKKFKFCSSNCYWKYHLKDILKNKVAESKKEET